jgi:O-antigen ligase
MGIVAVLVVCRRLRHADREVLLLGIIATALLLAAAGWLGVAFGLPAWRWEAQGVWRASSTLTYPNATAAVLGMVSILVLALLTQRRHSLALGLAATALLVGTGATLSRAGVLAVAAGWVVLAALAGVRTVARASLGPFIGAVVALGGLLPSMSHPGGASSVLAVTGLAAGLAVAAILASADSRAVVAVISALCTAGLLAFVASGPAQMADAADDVAGSRLTLASSERVDGMRAALHTFADHPVTGAGPGQGAWRWADPHGPQVSLRYVHNEYVQLAAELGLGGLALLAAALVCLARLCWRLRGPGAARPLWAGVVAGIVVVTVHSAFDFIWHIPAVPLLGAALLGLVLPPPTPRREQATHRPHDASGGIP